MTAIEREIVCVVCAKGCRAQAWEGEDGSVQVRGPLCRNGRDYVRLEFRDPRRIITTTVRVEGSGSRLPVRSRGPVPKGLLMECMREISGLIVSLPVHIEDVLIADLLGTGQDLIASSEITEASEPAWRARPLPR